LSAFMDAAVSYSFYLASLSLSVSVLTRCIEL
jgi:hypothetical protein